MKRERDDDFHDHMTAAQAHLRAYEATIAVGRVLADADTRLRAAKVRALLAIAAALEGGAE